MNKSKLIGMLFVVLGILVIAGSAYFIISYASGMLGAIVDFVTTNNFARLADCGVEPSPQLQSLKSELTTIILPFLYIGLPLLLIILSFLMFLGGFYYHKGKHKEESEKSEKMERDMLRKAVEKLQTKTGTKNSPAMEGESRMEEELQVEKELEEEKV